MAEPLTLIINGETAESRIISQMVRAFCSPEILRSCGGYVIVYRVRNDTAYLGVKPSILNGQRTNHYDLKAGPDTRVSLIGGINADGEISLLFKIPEPELSTDVKSELRQLYARFADLLKRNGYDGPGALDWVTQRILQESEIFSPVPLTILDLPAE